MGLRACAKKDMPGGQSKNGFSGSSGMSGGRDSSSGLGIGCVPGMVRERIADTQTAR